MPRLLYSLFVSGHPSGFHVRSSLFKTPLHNAHTIKYHSHNMSLKCIPAQAASQKQPGSKREKHHNRNPMRDALASVTQVHNQNHEIQSKNTPAAENPRWRNRADLFGLVNAQIITPNWVEVFYERCKTTHKHIKERLLKNACAYFS